MAAGAGHQANPASVWLLRLLFVGYSAVRRAFGGVWYSNNTICHRPNALRTQPSLKKVENFFSEDIARHPFPQLLRG
jgi:hypothetical protein